MSLLIAAPLLAGCSASRGLDDFAPPASIEITSSVRRPDASVSKLSVRPAPKRDITDIIEATEPEQPAEQPIISLAEEGDAVAEATEVSYVPTPREVAPTRAIRGEIVSRRFRDAKPINFGKRKPRDHPVHGVDVSRWQGNIDWARLRSQGANFAYIKATDGGDHLDPMFRTNWRGAKQAGIKRGAYHFFYWCRSAESQAKWFIRNVPRDPEALPPVLDVEWNGESSCRKRPSRAVVLEKMKVFMDRIEAHYGQRPVIYTAPDFYEDNLSGEFTNYPFWLRSVARHPSKVYPNRKWLFWQYSGSGLSHGVKGRIDLNVFRGSESEWWNWVGGREAVAQAD